MAYKFLEIWSCPICGKLPNIDRDEKSFSIFCCVLTSLKLTDWVDQNEVNYLVKSGSAGNVNETLTKEAIIQWNKEVALFKEA